MAVNKMQFLRDLIHNSMLVAPVTAWVVAQLLKAIYGRIKSGKFAAERLVGPGGMPSSHAAMTTALVVMVGRVESVASPMFAIAVVLTAIVMYDATGVRWHAGQQAKVINGCSQLFIDVFGENGRHARSAIGTNSLPLGLTVEVESIWEIEE